MAGGAFINAVASIGQLPCSLPLRKRPQCRKRRKSADWLGSRVVPGWLCQISRRTNAFVWLDGHQQPDQTTGQAKPTTLLSSTIRHSSRPNLRCPESESFLTSTSPASSRSKANSCSSALAHWRLGTRPFASFKIFSALWIHDVRKTQKVYYSLQGY